MKIVRLLHPILIRIVPSLASAFSMLMGCSSKLKIIAPESLNTRKKIFEQNSLIWASWHSRFFYFSYFGRGKHVVTMISASKDGDFITETIRKMGLDAVRGSSSSRGHEALEEMAQQVNAGRNVLMIPDGPKGPKGRLKPGVIRLAQITGKPVVPVSFSTTSGIFFPSWDNFLLPLPWGKCVFYIGEPVYVPAEATPEEFEEKRQTVEKMMNWMSEESDRLCGRNPEKEAISWLGKRKCKSIQ